MRDNIRRFPAEERQIELALLKTASSALERTTTRTGLTEEQAVNVAITVYDLITERLESGATVVFRHPDNTTSKLIWED